MESNPAPVYYTKDDKSFFRKRHNSTIAFTIGLLVFFLPFANLNCGPITLMSNTGIGIATGKEWKMNEDSNRFMDKIKSGVKNNEAKRTLNAGLNIFLLIALAAGAFGLFTGFFDQKWKHIAGTCAALLACIMLLAVMIQLNILLRSSLKDSAENLESEGGDGLADMMKIKFTFWYFISLLSFICAAFFSYKHHKLQVQDELDNLVSFEFQQEQTPVIAEDQDR